MRAGVSTQKQAQRVLAELNAAMKEHLPKVRQAHRWEYEVLRWCLKDATLRTQILRLIDCLPSLQSPREIVEHLQQYLPRGDRRLPLPLRLGLSLARPSLLTAKAVAMATHGTVSKMARLFIAGATPKEAFQSIARLKEQGFSVTVDLLGEATLSEEEANRYCQSVLQLIREWPSHLDSSPHLSLKLSGLAFPFDPVDPEGTWKRIFPRFNAILQAALAQNGFVNIDMEQSFTRDLTLGLTQRILEEPFPFESRIGVVIQAYLKDSEGKTRQLLQWVAQRKVPITIRLVRGAYWDTEVIFSRQRGWPCPVYMHKEETDRSFEKLTDLLFEHHEVLRIAIATHNLSSIAHAIVKAKEKNVPKENWECQVLYGMGEAIQQATLRLGIPTRIYTPIGELIPGMAYLVRRILENTSQSSFLATSLFGGAHPHPNSLADPSSEPSHATL